MPEFEKIRRLLPNSGSAGQATLVAYVAAGGYEGLKRALHMTPEAVSKLVQAAGLRGRGGAGSPAAQKWSQALNNLDPVKYIICHAYDADPLCLSGPALLVQNPHLVLEGMLIAAYASGAQEGFFYLNSGRQYEMDAIHRAFAEAAEGGYLGRGIMDTPFSFQATVIGVNTNFMAGEETVMIKILEAKRGMPEQRPPYPSQNGISGHPTVVNNSETLANVPGILTGGAEAFGQLGSQESKGTKLVTVYGAEQDGTARNGVALEVPFGTALKAILAEAGLGDSVYRALHVGGPLGGLVPPEVADTLALDYKPLQDAGVLLGSGTIELVAEDTCMVDYARKRSDYLSKESCGKCIPCRVGMKRITGLLEGISSDLGKSDDLRLLTELGRYIPDGSLCGFGVHAPRTLMTAMRYFPSDFSVHIDEERCPTGQCIPTRIHRYRTRAVL